MSWLKIQTVKLTLSSKPTLRPHFPFLKNDTPQARSLGAGLRIAPLYSVTKPCPFSAS